MNRLFASLSIVLLGLSLAFVSSAQNPQPPSRRPTASPTPSPTPDSDIVDVNIRRVRLPITVQDKKKQFVSGLTQGDFLILEDKVPQTIDSFTSEANNNLPLYVAVLMDTSPSTAAKMKFQQEAAMNFIQTVVRPRRDRVLFATFDHEVTLRQDFTDRLELLDKAVYAVKKTGEKTALWDAIWQFSDQKMRSVPG
ncbi:MAG: VWA domain-containing protein, partial [Pyrinomonadaceae bacterium]